MAPVLHTGLDAEKWNAFPKSRQVLMIASELNRAGHWIERADAESMARCDERAFELIDLSVQDPKWGKGRRELMRFRELLAERYLNQRLDGAANRALLEALLKMDPEAEKVMGHEV
jgi:hypothetical protein